MASPQSLTSIPPPPPPKFGSKSKDVGWYMPTLTYLTPTQRDLLENYSHITSDDIIPHILAIRDKAWEIHAYPCIGLFRFLDLSLYLSPSYSSLLTALQSGSTLLDLGCCFAQDLRKLVHDGAPSKNLYGMDLHAEFLELGYELFDDRERFEGGFLEGDIFDDGNGGVGELKSKIDIVHAGMFLHLFDLVRQVEACLRLVQFFKEGKGRLVGQQVGRTEALQLGKESGSRMFQHDEQSFRRMWEVVGEKTGTEWKVDVSLKIGEGKKDGEGKDLGRKVYDDPKTRLLVFDVKRVV